MSSEAMADQKKKNKNKNNFTLIFKRHFHFLNYVYFFTFILKVITDQRKTR